MMLLNRPKVSFLTHKRAILTNLILFINGTMSEVVVFTSLLARLK